ncbi:MAG: response regulator [Rikenellaceae bacterium]|nr:response regulator [Rikenellaceae bacterium]
MKNKGLLPCFFLLLLPVLISEKASAFEHVHLNDPQGVMSNSVSGVIKDSEGFLWIASRSGITRYDGKVYRHYSLFGTEIFENSYGREVHIRQSREGRIWAFTDSGRIFAYDPNADSFSPFYDTRLIDPYRVIHDILPLGDTNLLLGTTKGLVELYESGGDIDETIHIDDVSINCIATLPGRLLALGTTTGVWFVTAADDRYTHGRGPCEGINIMSLWFDSVNDHLWMGSFSSGLYTWDMAGGVYINLPYTTNINSAPVKAIRPWNGQLLVGQDGRGIYKVDTLQKASVRFISDEDSVNGVLKANNVYDIFVDGNNIWVCTYSGGITLVKPEERYQWYRHIPYEHNSLKGSHVYDIHEDTDGDLWFATNLGVSLFSRKNGWKHFLQGENSFLTISGDGRGTVWTGGYSTGLYSIDKRTGRIGHIPSLSDGPELDCIYATYFDSDGDLWVGCLYTPLALVRDPTGRRETSFYDIRRVQYIFEPERDTVFVTTSNGFHIIDKRTGDRRQYFTHPPNYDVTSNSFIFSAVSEGGKFWFGTDGGGMNCFDPELSQVRNFSTYDGLPSNYVYALMLNDDGMLWGSTEKGIFCFDPVEEKLRFSIGNLPVNKYLFTSFARLSDGRMAFGGIDGALVFDPDRLKKDTVTARIKFTGFRLFYNLITPAAAPEILPMPVDELTGMVLRHDQNSFSFDYSAPDIYNHNYFGYRHILEGFEDNWNTDDEIITATYTNIPPGRYVLRVECFDRNNSTVISQREIKIRIKPPFWNTVWAWILYLLIFSGLCMWAWRYYRELMLKRQSRERINFFINVAHDIRTPLSLVLAPIGSLEAEDGLSEQGRKHLRMARQNGEKLQGIVSQLLDFHKDEMKGESRINLSVCDLKAFLLEKIDGFSPLAAEKEITLRFESIQGNVFVETNTRRLERIMDNLLSNAVKYSDKGGEVIVRLKAGQKKITIEVEDFGIGIPRREQGKILRHVYRAENAVNSQETGSGIGLMFTRRIARQIGAELTFTSQQGKGSIFTLTFTARKLNYVLSGEPEPEVRPGERPRRREYKDTYRILIVEDNDDMRNYLSDMLSADYKVFSVASAEAALEFLRRNMADLVVSDIMMPGMQGDELCRRIKENIETSHLHVILLTANISGEKMREGLGHGADDYINKPFDVEVLRIKIRNLLNTRVKLQQYYLNRLQSAPSDTVVPEDTAAPNLNEQFISRSTAIVKEHISDPSFTVNELYRELAMSRTLVFEKLKALTGRSPNEFIRVIRLQYARELLRSGGHSIADAALMAGFPDPKYFSTIFKKYFGESPSKMIGK